MYVFMNVHMYVYTYVRKYVCIQTKRKITHNSHGAKMGTWKCLRVQGFMTDPESIGVLKEIKLGCHDGNLGDLFLFA